MSSPTKEALARIRELKQQLAEAESGSNEPIAIVSTACRFPRRSNSPEAFWKSLMEEADETSELPEDRWDLDAYYDEDPDEPGKMYARRGTFLENLDEMDADFFGISPREATWIDPQQRLFLEVSWEALERAGWTTEETGKNTGVFVGWMHNDYQNEASESLLDLNPYIATGSAGSFLCGRLSYYLGVQGPSLAVDTACSSSLVALHLACQSLRQRECDRAIAGGVNVMVSPKTTIMTCKLHALSPQGHSRAFDASADGYLRGEGCGVVTLRRLSDAQRDGDEVLAVIRGSAITHNGFSSGLTAPNPDSQQKVIRKALDQAGLSPADVSYLEAHGTGTELGDPIEMNAAATVLGEGRDKANPLLVGSVKTNLGHLEAAAGIAGVIKTVLSIQHGKIPAHLHFETPNPHIAWDRLPVQIVTESRDWPSQGTRIAGVSAFGMSGTNAHIVIDSPPAASDSIGAAKAGDEGRHLLFLSGKSEGAVQQLAADFRELLSTDISSADLYYSAATRRRHFEKRAAVTAASREEMITSLSALAAGSEAPGLCFGQARPNPVVAWQFTGQGSQYSGMGRGLYEAEPVFRKVMDDCAAELSKYREGDLLDVIFNDGEALGETTWTQPALFAIHLALAELMKSRGCQPDIVLGHSLGQYAAACVAGMLDWKDGIRLIHERSRLTGSLPEGGAMAAVFADEEEVKVVAGAHAGLSIAAQNGSHTVISGAAESIKAAILDFGKKEIRAKRLDTSHAFHSELLDPILDEFEEVANSITFQPATCPLVCNVSGEIVPPHQILDGAYWRRQLREAVQFEKSIESLAANRCDLVLELGPQPFLTGMAAACWSGTPGSLISTLEKGGDEVALLDGATARLYQQGASLDFEALLNPSGDRTAVALPTYPFQRQRHWGPERPGLLRVQQGTQHPLLGEKRALAGVSNESRFENYIASDKQHWLGDHRVFEDILFPGAGYVEMAVAATQGSTVLENLAFEMPLMVSGPVTMQTVVRGGRDGGTLEIYSSTGAHEPWIRNVSATLSAEKTTAPKTVSRTELEDACTEKADVAAFYQMFASLGIQYGPEFQTIQSLSYNDSEVLARLELSGDHRGYFLPPMLLDGAFQSLAVGLLRDSDSSLFLPVGIERYSNFSSSALTAASSGLWCHGKWHETEGDMRTADLTLFDDRGHVVAHVGKLRVRAVSRTALRQMVGSGSDRLLYHMTWKPGEFPPLNNRHGQWLVVGGASEWNEKVAKLLGEKGQHAIQVELANAETVPDGPLLNDTSAKISATDFDQWLTLLTHYFPEEGPGQVNGIVWSTGEAPEHSTLEGVDVYTQRHCAGVLALLQGLRARKIEWLDRGLQIITGNAISILETDTVFPESTQVWGFGRVVGNEYPPLRGRLIDSPDESDEGIEKLTQILLTESRESQVALRGEDVFVPRLVPAKAPTVTEGLPVSEEASYLITGGLGMLGRRGAEWLGARGAKHVVLVSRREPTESTLEMISEIEESGCQVHVMLADISQRDSIEALLGRIKKELPPLRGILHAAGVLEDGLLVEQTWEGFEKVLAPKKRGAALLHELTLGTPLDFFVLYSSAASVLGSPGQANYATGNAFLDGLAYQRTAMGLPATSVNFGPWNEGMAATETVTKAMELQGMTPLIADEAHEAVDRLIDNGIIQATMLDVDWAKMRQRFPVEAPPLLDELWTESMQMAQGNAVLLEKLREAEESGEPREDIFKEHVETELQQVLSLPQPPGEDVPLAELGLDSLMAVEFATRLQQQVGSGFAIPPTLAFDYPSVSKLTAHLMELIDSVPAAEEAVDVQLRTEEDSIAIVGMGCRFPGADGIEAYWQLLRDGVDATCEIPADRWDVEGLYDPEPKSGKMYTKRGGFLPDIGEFDAEFFGLSEQDAAWMDPQHRMLLETSWQAMEDAGIVPDQLDDPQVGVFMGIMSTDYAQLRERVCVENLEGSQGAGLSHSAGVGRLSYMFGFEGPSIAVDTASSSSLVAVCQAARSLLDGDCNVALAGGVNAILSPVNSLLLCKGGVLAPDGRSKSFSAAADGFGRGEGCGVVVLKRLSDAERDGDRVLATIRGTAVGHNGQNGGLTAPSGRSQQQMLRKALANAGIQPGDVQYLEAHATGTELGDPIEVRAAAEVLGKGREETNPLLVGSAKANLSHLEAAGGISGLIKVVLSMVKGVIPGQIHFDEPSPHIPWDQIRAKVVTGETPWPNPNRPVAGVNALGMTGTNAHVILEGGYSFRGGSESNDPSGDQLLVLSGKTKEGLRELAGRYASHLAALPESDFAALCDTAATGRKHFGHRVALLTDCAETAASRLRQYFETGAADGIQEGSPEGAPTLAWAYSGEMGDLLAGAKSFDATEPVFREALEFCSKQIGTEDMPGLREEWLGEEASASSPAVTIPGLFAIQMAFSKLWESWGIEPDVVTGEGVGQYAAACAAGMMDWEDGIQLAAKRGQLIGDAAKPEDSVLDEFEGFVDTIDHRPPDRPIVCGLSGRVVPVHKVFGGSYWRGHLDAPLLLKESAEVLHAQGCKFLFQIGGSGFVESLVKEMEGEPPEILSGTKRETLASLYTAGANPDFVSYGKPRRTRRVPLPGYPFQRKYYWLPES
jgi:acyl transferase domain-containing protein/acyl carrier protein